ncbi:MAG TPA: Fic family protein [Steroidobacteraceae bacterium]
MQRRVAAGELHRVRSGIATPLPETEWPALFRREKARVLAAFFPKAVVAFRSAFDGMVGTTIYLAVGYARVVELPGLKVVLSSGPDPVDGDGPIQGRELYFPSRERMLLDAMAPPPRTDDPQYSRKISAEELENRMISICDSRGEASFLELRDRVQVIGGLLGTPKSHLEELDRLMGAILGTRPDRKMATSKGAGRAKGYDAPRMDLFHKLVQVLKTNELQRIADVAGTSPATTNFAVLESYFSNFIEGTEFEIGEARAIALEGKISELRLKDSHDIKGVFDQARDVDWRARGITDIQAFEETLRERHALMMAARPEVLPGEFKVVQNVAGNTTFVEPRLVVGTLREAGLLMHDVDAGLPRALLAMFIVSEVHPFNDGNGRLARLVMNSELSAAGETRIIVPTLYREQYLDRLRELTRAARTEPYLDAMTNIQRWTAAFSYADLDETIDLMTRCNAFQKSLGKHQLLWPEDLDAESDPDEVVSTAPRG